MDPATAILIAGGIASAGQLYANKQNLDQQKWANDTQIHLANTAHQREVADLKAAGLNPVLSASGAGASVPALGVAGQGNVGQGIADAVSEAAKYENQAFKAQVDSVRANTEQVNLVNSALREQKEFDSEMAEAQNEALQRLLGKKVWADNGGVHVSYDNSVREKFVNLLKEGIESDLKMQANQNWRANLSSFVPFVSPAGINSAAGAYRNIKVTRKLFK